MRFLRRRHRHRFVTGYEYVWHAVYGWHLEVIFRGCACQSPFLRSTTEENR